MHSCSPVLFDSDTLIDKQTIQPSLPLEEQRCQQSSVQLKSIILETSAEKVVNEIRLRIEQKTGLTASAGKYIFIVYDTDIFTVHIYCKYVHEISDMLID